MKKNITKRDATAFLAGAALATFAFSKKKKKDTPILHLELGTENEELEEEVLELRNEVKFLQERLDCVCDTIC